MQWDDFNKIEQNKTYYKELYSFIKNEYATHICYPEFNNIFNALNTTAYDDVKCVILGQDPYHEPGQAMGLSFSVKYNMPIPKSLQNIYKELKAEYGYKIPDNGNLQPWAKQGVLLLNTVLTVREHMANSHQHCGWEIYTDNIIKLLNNKSTPIVFMLWGNNAKTKKCLITNSKHLVLEAAHPSPFSAYNGFFGCNHFKLCNNFLQKNNQEPIDWQIKNITKNQI